MRILLPPIIFIFFSFFAYSQDTLGEKPRYFAKIIDKQENYILSGALYEMTDSALILTCASCNAEEAKSFLIPISLERIGTIKIQSRNLINLSKFFYSSSIILGGIPASLSIYLYFRRTVDEEFQKKMGNAYYDAIRSLMILTVIGSLPGTILGIFTKCIYNKKILINNNKELLDQNRNLIKKYCFIQ